MSDLERLSIKNIRELITKTEDSLKELKTELKRREEAAQEEEIEHLDAHMKRAELSLKTIREFVAFLLDEYRSKSKS